MAVEVNQGCNTQIGCIISLTCLKSCINLQFPNFILITKQGEIHGELEGLMSNVLQLFLNYLLGSL